MKTDPTLYLESVFGEYRPDLPIDEIAKRSKRKFVRSGDHIAFYELDVNPNATGHVMTAWEAYRAFGLDILVEAMEYGSAVILSQRHAIENSLKNRREELGLSPRRVARAAGVSEDLVAQAEKNAHSLHVQDLERIAFVLGLDERRLAYHPTSRADDKLAARLKTLTAEPCVGDVRLSERSVLRLAEAASIVRIQSELQETLLGEPLYVRFEPHADYGYQDNPAYRIGYDLADQARDMLELRDRPVKSMRDLSEDTLGIPVIQASLQDEISGATVAAMDSRGIERRGIVLNFEGPNQNVWARRITLAHEIAHLLYDPDDRLERVRVDSYDGNNRNPEYSGDYVEQRANAFAVAFLAPLDAVRRREPAPFAGEPISGEAISRAMRHFGMSLTSARFHLANAYYRQYDTPSNSDILPTWPDDVWKAAENFTLDYFPIQSTPIQRRGRFAGLVAAAHDRGLISDHTAAAYLNCDASDFRDNCETILSLYPIRGAGVR